MPVKTAVPASITVSVVAAGYADSGQPTDLADHKISLLLKADLQAHHARPRNDAAGQLKACLLLAA